MHPAWDLYRANVRACLSSEDPAIAATGRLLSEPFRVAGGTLAEKRIVRGLAAVVTAITAIDAPDWLAASIVCHQINGVLAWLNCETGRLDRPTIERIGRDLATLVVGDRRVVDREISCGNVGPMAG